MFFNDHPKKGETTRGIALLYPASPLEATTYTFPITELDCVRNPPKIGGNILTVSSYRAFNFEQFLPLGQVSKKIGEASD